MKYIYTICLLLTTNFLFANKEYIDSLEKWLIANPVEDTQRAMNTHRLSYRLSEINPSKAWEYARETERISRINKFTKGICLSNINYAILEANEGNFEKSAHFYFEAIKYAEEINYTRGISIAYNNIGDNYLKIKNYDKVLEYTWKAFDINKSIGEKRGQGINLEQIGQIYFLKKEYEKAIKYWNESMELIKDQNDLHILTQLQIDISKYYTVKGDYTKAINILNKTLETAIQSEELLLQTLTCKAFAETFLNVSNYDSALLYYNKGMTLVKKLGNPVELSDIYYQLSKLYYDYKKFDSAYHYLNLYKILSDSVTGDKSIAHIAYLQTKYESDLKDKENKELKTIQKTQRKKLYEKNTLLILVTVALLLALLSVFLFYRQSKIRKKQLILEEEKNKSIHSQQITEMEILSLRSQMNPHFLFNSLNSIRNYILKNEPQIASNYLANFASLMRKILDTTQQNTISLDEEIEMLKLYIELEQLRFSNKYTYNIYIEESIKKEDYSIPSMILQPFIENAIWHGLLHKEEGAHLQINFKELHNNDYEILCEIIDNGIGRKASKEATLGIKKHISKGIQITKDRLDRLSKIKQKNAIQIIDMIDEKGNPKGTKVVILLPVF